MIEHHLTGIKEILFIPYAGFSASYDDGTIKVQNAFQPLGIKLTRIH